MYARRNLRRVDVLVNNAGIYLEVSGTTVKDRISALDARLEVVRAILETNLIGPFALSQGIIALMRDQGDEQPDADGDVARRHGQNRGGGEGCGYAASLGQRKRVAHIPTAEAARSGLFLEGQGQARLHLKSKDPWSHEWGPVHFVWTAPAADILEKVARGRQALESVH